MKITARVLAALLCILMFMSAVACTGNSEQTTNDATTEPDTYAPSEDTQTQSPEDTSGGGSDTVPSDTTDEQQTDPALTGGIHTNDPEQTGNDTPGVFDTLPADSSASDSTSSDAVNTTGKDTTIPEITRPVTTTSPTTTAPVTTSPPETQPPTEPTATPKIEGVYHCANDRVIIYGTCESGSTMKSWGTGEKVQYDRAGGKYFYIEHSVSGSKTVNVTATAPGKTESKSASTKISSTSGVGMSVFGGKNSRLIFQATLPHLMGQMQAQSSMVNYVKNDLVSFREQVCNATGKDTKIIYIIAPNPCTVYYDEMRDYIAGAVKGQNKTPAWQFVEVMQGVDGFIVPDLYTEFTKLKNQDIFFRTDTHWSELGAFYAYNRLMPSIKSDFPNTPCYTLNDFNVVYEDCSAGDMAGMIGANGMREDTPFLYPKFSLSKAGAFYEARRASGNSITCNVGAYPTSSSVSGRNLPTCYFMADSYGAYFLPFAGMSFGNMCGNSTGAMWNYTVDWNLLREKKPDYLLYVYTDRNIDENLTQLFAR